MAADDSNETLTAERAAESTIVADRRPNTAPAQTQTRGRSLRSRAPEVVEAVAKVVRGRRAWPSAYLITLIGFVIVPAAVVSLYFAILASDQYAVETRFAVSATRNDVFSEKLTTSNSSGYAAAGQDAYVVSGYIRSRAIIDDLAKVIDLRSLFSRPEADFWARLKPDATTEELTDYWRDMVDSYVDGLSGIVTVNVRAFRRDDALAIAKAIVEASEALVNKISARARVDAMKMAEKEVATAEDRVVASLAELRVFRDQAGFIDPTLQASSTASMLTELLSRRIRLQTEYIVSSRAMSTDAPTVQGLKSRIESLDQQIAEQKAKLTSASVGEKSLASLLPKFEELDLREKFAEKIYGLAQDGLTRARVRADARTIYVTVFVPPAPPQEARYPERLGLSLVIAITLFVLWGIGALTAAIVEDHRI